MEYIQPLEWLFIGAIGLSFGSFLNVVIYRTPKILENKWAAECSVLSGKTPPITPPYNLLKPASSCQACNHQIRWSENIPIFSYISLRGKCGHCHAKISIRYPFIELLTCFFFLISFTRWGFTPSAWTWSLFCAALLALAAIDWDTTLLPDNLTLPLLWGGLCAAALEWSGTDFTQAFWGAVGGYLSLWTVFWAFKLTTGKDGMGYGDFKLFAALGAWFGWPALIPIILMASVTGALVGIAMKTKGHLREGGYIPFGPFLAVGGFTAMWASPSNMLALVGL